MRILPTTLFSLALAACGSGQGDGADNLQAGAPVDNLAATAAAPDPMPRILAAMAGVLVDPAAALYSNLRQGSVGSHCGAVALPRPDGTHAPPVPFVVTPDGNALTSATPHLSWDAPEDPFPTAYARWCATPEELEAMRAAIAASPAPPPPEELPPPEDLPEEEAAAAPPAPPQPQPRATRPPSQPRPARQQPPSDPNDVSFINAVRPPED